MVSSRVRSILVGHSGTGILPSLAVGGGLFATFLVASLAYHGLLQWAVRGWPTLTDRSVLAFGALEIAYADLTWVVYLGLFGVAMAAAGYAAMREEGFLTSVLWATAPFLGYMVAATLFYSQFTYAGYSRAGSIEWTLPITVSLIYGVAMGLLGFVIGRIVVALD